MSRSELLIRFGEHHLVCLSLASLTTLRCPLDGARIVRITKADQLALFFEGTGRSRLWPHSHFGTEAIIGGSDRRLSAVGRRKGYLRVPAGAYVSGFTYSMCCFRRNYVHPSLANKGNPRCLSLDGEENDQIIHETGLVNGVIFSADIHPCAI